jgi:hypothetical protein
MTLMVRNLYLYWHSLHDILDFLFEQGQNNFENRCLPFLEHYCLDRLAMRLRQRYGTSEHLLHNRLAM